MVGAHLYRDPDPMSLSHHPHTMTLTLHLDDLGNQRRQMSASSPVPATHGTF